MKTRVILVGGFLGSGKTTLLWEAAKRLLVLGYRVGLITNDQAPELVDTAFLSRAGVKVGEVAGSCFCCNFGGLIDTISKIRAQAQADVILAEPVGSCTDLSATIMQPLKDHFGHELAISPFSVMVDPLRLSNILDGITADMHPSAAYIFRKQMEEADILILNKMDLLTADEKVNLKARLAKAYPGKVIFTMSVKNGEGVDAWLEEVTHRSDAGHHLAEVDYDIYAEGESLLGWLNATIELRGELVEWYDFAESLLKALGERFDSIGAFVGHVKVMVEAGDSFLIGNLTGKNETLSIRGSTDKAPEARLMLNARVQIPPRELEVVVQDVLEATCKGVIKWIPRVWTCLSPSRPNPTYRYDRVVTSETT